MPNFHPIRCLLALCLSLLAATAIAQPITRVFRADIAPPTIVFQNGFDSRGYRMDLLAHAIGGACNEADPVDASVWVSMTQDRHQAEAFAAGQLAALGGNVPDPVVWLYTIRADREFVSVPAALQQVIRAAEFPPRGVYTPNHARILHWIRARSLIDTEREVVSHVVHPANIVEAVPMRYEGGSLVAGTAVRNPAYIDIQSAVPVEIGNITGVIPPASIHMNYFVESNSSCSMSCDGSSPGSPSPMSMSKDYCAARSKHYVSPLLQHIILD